MLTLTILATQQPDSDPEIISPAVAESTDSSAPSPSPCHHQRTPCTSPSGDEHPKPEPDDFIISADKRNDVGLLVGTGGYYAVMVRNHAARV